MNLKKEIFWKNSEQLLKALLDQNSKELDEETIEAVQHYLDHSEYEMAFEGLFIEIMKLNNRPENLDFGIYTDLGKNLKLDVESVFDSNFWGEYIKYSSNK